MSNSAYPGSKGMIELTDTGMTVDGDRIGIAVTSSPPDAHGYNTAKIRLALAQDVTWWKMIQVVVVDYDPNRKIINETTYGEVGLKDDNKGPALALDFHT